ncbi:hypothetical protein PSHT_00330, partial [Puccinia striiformis]
GNLETHRNGSRQEDKSDKGCPGRNKAKLAGCILPPSVAKSRAAATRGGALKASLSSKLLNRLIMLWQICQALPSWTRLEDPYLRAGISILKPQSTVHGPYIDNEWQYVVRHLTLKMIPWKHAGHLLAWPIAAILKKKQLYKKISELKSGDWWREEEPEPSGAQSQPNSSQAPNVEVIEDPDMDNEGSESDYGNANNEGSDEDSNVVREDSGGEGDNAVKSRHRKTSRLLILTQKTNGAGDFNNVLFSPRNWKEIDNLNREMEVFVKLTSEMEGNSATGTHIIPKYLELKEALKRKLADSAATNLLYPMFHAMLKRVQKYLDEAISEVTEALKLLQLQFQQAKNQTTRVPAATDPDVGEIENPTIMDRLSHAQKLMLDKNEIEAYMKADISFKDDDLAHKTIPLRWW